MKKKKTIMTSIFVLSIIMLLTSNVTVFADGMNKNLDLNGIPIGEYRAVDEAGNEINNIDEFSKQRDSGQMLTRKSSTYSLKDGRTELGSFYSRAQWRSDMNQVVTSYGNYSSRAWAAYSGGTWAKARVSGRYKPNPSTARVSITGEAADTILQLYAAMDHVYYLYGNGSYDMSIFN